MKTRKYDVVIVNYNGEKIIADCLKSIYDSTIKPHKIIIFDNCSSDKSVELIEKQFPKVTLIKSKKNLGFGVGNNEGMSRSESDFILFLNNDVLLEKKCAERLLEGFAQPKIAIINPLIKKGWDRKPNSEIYAFGSVLDKYGFNYGLDDLESQQSYINCFSGACFMARAKIIKRYQFEKSYFLYYEEPELCVRLLKDSWLIKRDKAAECYHLESYSSPKKNLDGVAFRQANSIPNKWFMLGKHWPIRLLPSTILFNSLHLTYIVFFYLKNRQFKYLGVGLRAWLSFFRGLQNRHMAKLGDKYWYRELSSVELSNYLNLKKKVFKKSP